MSDEEIEMTQIRVEAASEGSLSEATTLRLVVEGRRDVVLVAAEYVVQLLQEAFGGKITGIRDGAGNDIAPPPEVIDVLATGDDTSV